MSSLARAAALLTLLAGALAAQSFPPSGGGGTAKPPYIASVTSTATTLSVPASTHGQNTKGLLVTCFDSAGLELVKVRSGATSGQYSVQTNPTTFDVTISFGASNNGGWCAVNGGGSAGRAGVNGANGADGRTILPCSGAPSNGAGNDGDYCYDSAAKLMYGPKVSGAWPTGVSLRGTDGVNGTNGTNGSNGLNGKTILACSGAPSNATGTDGDYCLDRTAALLYGPKASGVWPAGVSIRGANGNNGSNGTNGSNGSDGLGAVTDVFNFSNATSFSIPVSGTGHHNCGTNALTVRLRDAANGRGNEMLGGVSVDSSNNITLGFASATSGSAIVTCALVTGNFSGNASQVQGVSIGTNTVSFSSTPTFSHTAGTVQRITLTGNVTSSTLTGLVAGAPLVFQICQDPTGSRTFAWPANVKGGMTIGATASKCSTQAFTNDGTTAYGVGFGQINQ